MHLDGCLCCVVCAEIIGLLFYIFSPKLIGFFNVSGESLRFGVIHMRTICLFFSVLAFSDCMAGVMRGAGTATVAMFTMLACWCVIRVSYITVAVKFVNKLTTISWAYPITWILSSIVLLGYFLKADWIHNFDKTAKKA